jgi:hypothetical protein
MLILFMEGITKLEAGVESCVMMFIISFVKIPPFAQMSLADFKSHFVTNMLHLIHVTVEIPVLGPLCYAGQCHNTITNKNVPLGFYSRQGQEIFLFATDSRPALGPTHPPIQWLPGDIFPREERPRREADHHEFLTSAPVMVPSFSFTSPIHLHGVVLS